MTLPIFVLCIASVASFFGLQRAALRTYNHDLRDLCASLGAFCVVVAGLCAVTLMFRAFMAGLCLVFGGCE
jgi:ABC-type Fe3+ transport system permease subunit